MVLGNILQRAKQKKREKKELIKQMDNQIRAEKILEDRRKSANERELEKYMNEEREKMIKEKLEYHRKARDHDIRFNHNPLDVPNITNKTQWEVMKEKNLFTGKRNMFAKKGHILKNNRKLLKSNMRLMK